MWHDAYKKYLKYLNLIHFRFMVEVQVYLNINYIYRIIISEK